MKLRKGEESDWAWDLVGMGAQERYRTIASIQKRYSKSDMNKIKRKYLQLVTN